MLNVKGHLDLLGFKVKDRVTGFTGVVTSISFDLYGCIQAIVHPGLDKDGKPLEQNWFDVNRLQLAGERVMPLPNFDFGPIAEGLKGPADKQRFTKS